MVLEEEGGDPARPAAAPGGGGTEKGVVDQVGEGQGYLPAPRGRSQGRVFAASVLTCSDPGAG